MRYIYVDEAGTSEEEPVTIVVGLVVHPDYQLMQAEAAIQEALHAVPQQFREGFCFHATEVWGSPKYKDVWAQTDRMNLMHAMMFLPRRLGIPIALGMARRNSPQRFLERSTFAKFQEDHLIAFQLCLSQADRYIRLYGEISEVATVVAEDHPEMRRFLKVVPKALRDRSVILERGMFRKTEEDKNNGYVAQSGEIRATRIRNGVHFVEKDEDPLTQIADACAFGFRRYFAEQSFGDAFVRSILGYEPVKSDYQGGQSGQIFRFASQLEALLMRVAIPDPVVGEL